MYEAVIWDPWASWGVTERTAELEMLLLEKICTGLVEGSTEGDLRRERCDAREAEVKDLVAEGTNRVLIIGAECLLESLELGSGWGLRVE